ncbi:MAG: hypothetical protein HY914_15210 [Desulfomonile tiedjei]|nr:hypothetical protein [Desulfomonile tiedjei]
MDTDQLVHLLVAAACGLIFITTFLAGDIAGAFIEARWKKKWRAVGEKMGLVFDGTRERSPALSELLLPKVIFPGTKESPFCYGEILKTLRGTVQGFNVVITDFLVWDYLVRGPLVFRSTVCIVTGEGIEFPAEAHLVRSSSTLFRGFASNRSLRTYDFPADRAFSLLFTLFGRRESPPWVFNPDLRLFCVKHHRGINSLMIRPQELVLVWNDSSPDRLPTLLSAALGLATRLAESSPQARRVSQQ